MHKLSCPICTSDSVSKFLSVNQYDYWVCQLCRAAFLPNIDETEQKERHQGSEYRQSRIKAESKHKNHNKWLVLSMKKVKPRGRVLEVGCGAGFLVREMCNAGYDAVGVDLGNENAEFANDELGVKVLNQDFLSMEGAFDIVIMHQLIEHVPNPLGYVAHAKTLLAKDGLFVLSTPNLFVAKILAKAPKPFLGDALGHPPNHCILFEPKTMKYMLDRCGFQTLSIQNNPTGLKTESDIRHIADKVMNTVRFLGPNMLVYATPR